MSWEIEVQKTDEGKNRPADEHLGFGNVFTDHMFIADYKADCGWQNPRVIPLQPLQLEPSAACFHYGQTIFEGMKAYNSQDGRTLLFRPEDNAARLNKSSERMCMPMLNEELFVQAVKKTVAVDRDWIPTAEGTALYIRPFVIATEAFLGLKPSSAYKFIIIMSPVGSYYEGGLDPTRIYVETEHVRSVEGGTGAAKTGGNYARGLKAEAEAKEMDCDQVLWLDGKQGKYVEEVGAMNVFFRIDDEVVTPPLEEGTILAGITRDSVIKLLKDWGVPVKQRRIAINEIADAYSRGTLQEAFGTGTAAVISPIGELLWDGITMEINDGQTGELTGKIYDELTGIQTGKIEDRFGWTEEISAGD